MPENMTIQDYIDRLLTAQPTLDPELFDYTELMIPEMREKLLRRAEFMIKETEIDKIPGIEIEDIQLCGSAATYFYRKFSDIDLKIKVKNKDCPFLSKEKYPFEMFVTSLGNRLYFEKYKFHIGERPVDIKISVRNLDLLGLYSIRNNKWLIYPTSDACAKIKPEELLQAYEERKNKIEKEVEEIRQQYQGIELYNKMFGYYTEQILNNDNLKDFLVFKLLNYHRVLRSVGAESIRSCQSALSLK